ncbi:MIP/aquaporin family protein [Arthrobacter sp. FW306-04-A]|uniref:MIP/aquaporin family protein n=1 Tax=Arthrobacter sp. FW306-04-A TaxID=2879619 RepID=UPI0037BF4CEF|nr:aquaporin [Arthrobacter sp. FW306-04-A]
MADPEPAGSRAQADLSRENDHLPGLGLSGDQRAQVDEFNDPAHELRRLFSETFGTFLLVLAAAGADIIDSDTGGAVGRVAAVTAPGLTVTAIILFMGTNSGAHLNPVVTLAFALRRDFPWRRVPGYILAQLTGATTAAVVLRLTFGLQDHLGGTHPSHGFTPGQALIIEVLLTLGLVSTILGAASGAQSIGPLSALAAGAYIVLAGLWAGPVSGSSMNPARSAGPAFASGDYNTLWIYILGPAVGMLLAVGAAYILRGPGGGPTAAKAAQGKSTPTAER